MNTELGNCREELKDGAERYVLQQGGIHRNRKCEGFSRNPLEFGEFKYTEINNIELKMANILKTRFYISWQPRHLETKSVANPFYVEVKTLF